MEVYAAVHICISIENNKFEGCYSGIFRLLPNLHPSLTNCMQLVCVKHNNVEGVILSTTQQHDQKLTKCRS